VRISPFDPFCFRCEAAMATTICILSISVIVVTVIGGVVVPSGMLVVVAQSVEFVQRD